MVFFHALVQNTFILEKYVGVCKIINFKSGTVLQSARPILLSWEEAIEHTQVELAYED